MSIVLHCVPLGKVLLQEVDFDSEQVQHEVLHAIGHTLRVCVGQMLQSYLDREVTHLLKRSPYERRWESEEGEIEGECQRCHSRNRRDFYRNGSYPRWIVTQHGCIAVQRPQLKCRCQGNVKYRSRVLPRYRRLAVDVEVFIEQEYQQGQSYRQIKARLDERVHSSFGLRRLNQQVLQYGQETEWYESFGAGQAPPVLRLDAIWVTVCISIGETKIDRTGRCRLKKERRRIPILVAQGVWPAQKLRRVVAWKLVDGEDGASWQAFLEALQEHGISPEHGLRMVVTDGSAGFAQAHTLSLWRVPHQRCVFHKLQNIKQALDLSAYPDPQSRRSLVRTVLRQAREIWKAPTKTEAYARYEAFCAQWVQDQPEAVATLRRDFDDTLTFYDVRDKVQREQGEHWPETCLRTTSPLERTFRELRRRFAQAVLFQSKQGVCATTALFFRSKSGFS